MKRASLCAAEAQGSGRIVMHAAAYARETGATDLLPAILAAPDHDVRGYGPDDRTFYGTGAAVVATRAIPDKAAARLADPRVVCVHVRSVRNNCHQVRIDRDWSAGAASMRLRPVCPPSGIHNQRH